MRLTNENFNDTVNSLLTKGEKKVGPKLIRKRSIWSLDTESQYQVLEIRFLHLLIRNLLKLMLYSKKIPNQLKAKFN